jgi:hypothetical protein
MTPDQISAVAAIAGFLRAVGTLPFGVIIVIIVIGPWIGMAVASFCINRNLDKVLKKNQEDASIFEKRFEAVVRMYENNVEMVRDYNKLAGDLTSIITLSTRTLEGMVQKIENNQWCPLARKGVGRE